MSLQLFTSEMEEIQYEFLLPVNYDPDEEFAICNKAVADNCNSESDSESDSDDDDDGEEMEMEDQYQVISQEYDFAVNGLQPLYSMTKASALRAVAEMAANKVYF
ncbi:hypothetical protein BJV82DRAFT_584485 [Fennellomyces sp. T-0311]|nr:hypothetical protein BJV82DRAFT_584485 [Fennellomyces sp. T-0311]